MNASYVCIQCNTVNINRIFKLQNSTLITYGATELVVLIIEAIFPLTTVILQGLARFDLLENLIGFIFLQ